MITKWIQFTVAEEDAPRFREALEALSKESALEEGCAHYSAYSVDGKTDQFAVFESWETAEALEAHRQAPHMAAFKENAGGLITKKEALSVSEI